MRSLRSRKPNTLLAVGSHTLRFSICFGIGASLVAFISYCFGAGSFTILMISFIQFLSLRIALILFCIFGMASVWESMK
jgi:uncharacterized membrane protein YfhO